MRLGCGRSRRFGRLAGIAIVPIPVGECVPVRILGRDGGGLGSWQFQIAFRRFFIVIQQRILRGWTGNRSRFFPGRGPFIGSAAFGIFVEQQIRQALFLPGLLGLLGFAQEVIERAARTLLARRWLRSIARARLFAPRVAAPRFVRGGVFLPGRGAEQLLGQVFPGVVRIGWLFGRRAHESHFTAFLRASQAELRHSPAEPSMTTATASPAIAAGPCDIWRPADSPVSC